MTESRRLAATAAALFTLSLAADAVVNAAAPQANPTAEAAKASPELVGALSKELGATPEQSAGAAGALLGIAKSRLKPEEFSEVSKAVPGIDALLSAAPALGAASGSSGGGLSQIAGSAAGLAGAASAFSKLGLSPNLVAKAVPVLISFVTKSGGANVGGRLASVLK